MANHNVIFSGPAGSGKTTAIAAISDIEPFFTGEVAADAAPERGIASASALDYGRLKLDNGENLHLYGTPGQAGLAFDWDSLAGNKLGLVLLIDNQCPDPMADLQSWLNLFADLIPRNAIAVGITRSDVEGSQSVEDYQRVLLAQNLNIPVFEVDARESGDVTMLLQALLYNLDPCIEH
jgi:signal recognition particle receptor subunit beta